jgi:hypothetical protein
MLYYFPNRPTLIPPDPKNPLDPKPDYIDSLEASGKYVGELKWNGDNILIYTDTMEIWNRHRERHHYIPTPEVLDELRKFPKGAVINAELMHNRTVEIKNTIIVHCVMVWDGKPLIGKTWGDARKIIETLPYGEHVKLSEIFRDRFWERFQSADVKTVEGIILKNPLGRLVFSTTPIDDVAWMLKIRKPCKKYSF